MKEQPEALGLAARLDMYKVPTARDAAAELRRLHAENERLHQINKSHEMKLSVRGYEIRIADLEAQRDALLAALKDAADSIESWAAYASEYFQTKHDLRGDIARARAAIAAAEGE